MAFSQLSSKIGTDTSFARLETRQVNPHQGARTFNLKLSIEKGFISTAAGAFSAEQCQILENELKNHSPKKQRSGCYGRPILRSECTMHAATNKKVIVADDKMDGRTLYDVLGVSKKAEAKDIKAAYRQKVRRLHPDVAPLEKREESTTAFLKIHAAYITLANPRSRARYDLQLSLMSFHASVDTDGKYCGIKRVGGIGESICQSNATAAETSTSYPWVHASSEWRGRNWETDQCW
ncbi:hypothetical protein O6H91_08G025100 [Diphasiastrum complanatum]|uniref:Uncharacterized protein n=3 Tax=Diphasiastrum complanatum TaxID=34168 RepID=A0ACC2CVV3_DIPCM|nr:hypothetical protein O6H91_08G025100 [Diphasiastrum complanatum]